MGGQFFNFIAIFFHMENFECYRRATTQSTAVEETQFFYSFEKKKFTVKLLITKFKEHKISFKIVYNLNFTLFVSIMFKLIGFQGSTAAMEIKFAKLLQH